ncbi:hypothetical protein FOA43_002147 [Brettanomyces nanus]|uniref:GID complex catalytic subunit 2 n=1 Tax=Eeniella nana TaxID=13502 RepID=A0A875RZ53_EENNA|nr:uncharacterized protein FOA43_002147 [Brettanomyces nanus]QPG74811.1 hypothetical protein FOA43_002147 [Brettanomyces nanus]
MSRAQTLTEEIDKLSGDDSLEMISRGSDDFLGGLKRLKEKISNNEPYDIDSVEKDFKNWHDNSIMQEKKIHRSLRNYTSKTEKLFDFDLDSVCHYNKVSLVKGQTEELLDRAIVMDLLRNGQFSLATEVCTETKLPFVEELVSEFKELRNILTSIEEEFELGPAIKWAVKNSNSLREDGSDLEFLLHKIQFLKISMQFNSEPFEAYAYAKRTFPKFAKRHLNTISKLLGTLAFGEDIEIPDDFSIPDTKKMLCNKVVHDYCSLINLSARSPLFNTLLASYMALPAFKKYNRIANLSNKLNWTTQNELPFEINLPQSLQFHSIFICPVSKEETTDDNPPMVLPCRHLISQDSLQKLSKNGISSFKCPYCPRTCLCSQAKQAKFMNI